MRQVLLGIGGLSYGMISAAGVFTALAAVGLIPRFTGRTHTAKYTMLYETVVIIATMTGCYFSVFARYGQIGKWCLETLQIPPQIWNRIGICLQAVYGVFSGMFVGCLALAIAEMLDSIPIFSRRIGFRHGLGLAILGISLGKLTGSIIYFTTLIR